MPRFWVIFCMICGSPGYSRKFSSLKITLPEIMRRFCEGKIRGVESVDIKYVKEFITIAKTGNLPTAADQHYISPSLLSLHIRKIEEELGYPLFDRTSRTLSLNEQGRLFLPYAKKIASVFDEYRLRASNGSEAGKDLLNIGLLGSVAQITTENLIAEFYKDNPDVRFYIKSRDFPNLLISFLDSGECSFVFLYDPDAYIENVTVMPLFTDRIVAVVPLEHPLAGRSHIDPTDMANEQILIQTSDSKVFQKIMRYFAYHGVSLNVSFAVNSHSLMEDLLEINASIGLMTMTSAEKLKNRNLLFLPVEPELSIEFSMLYSSKPGHTPAEERFLQYIRGKFHKIL